MDTHSYAYFFSVVGSLWQTSHAITFKVSTIDCKTSPITPNLILISPTLNLFFFFKFWYYFTFIFCFFKGKILNKSPEGTK